jgi:glycosyltransferase involved in cell wall biosynthesis
MMRLAVVVQRYGEDVTGGSESLARAVAERLTTDHRVTVLTTCARDYVTWRNELPTGRSELNGVEVLRFPSDSERDLDAFNAFAEPLYARQTTPAEEAEFLRRQGPYAPRLIEHLARERDRYDAVLFFTYLYYPTVAGLEAAPERSILIPTAHDEPPLRFGVFQQAFARARAFAFCSRPEEELVRSRFTIGARPTAVAGIGVDVPERVDAEGFRIRREAHGPYALYAGRIDAGKGCAEMIAHHARYRDRTKGGAELLLIGRLAMPEPSVPGIRYLGFLGEEEKLAAMAGARALVCPSPYESLSIVLLEGFALGAPALVNGRSPVLLDHCRRSNGGLYYETADEYAEAMDLLVCRPSLASRLGENGRRYVAESYRWPVVMERYRQLVEAVRG